MTATAVIMLVVGIGSLLGACRATMSDDPGDNTLVATALVLIGVGLVATSCMFLLPVIFPVG